MAVLVGRQGFWPDVKNKKKALNDIICLFFNLSWAPQPARGAQLTRELPSCWRPRTPPRSVKGSVGIPETAKLIARGKKSYV